MSNNNIASYILVLCFLVNTEIISSPHILRRELPNNTGYVYIATFLKGNVGLYCTHILFFLATMLLMVTLFQIFTINNLLRKKFLKVEVFGEKIDTYLCCHILTFLPDHSEF